MVSARGSSCSRVAVEAVFLALCLLELSVGPAQAIECYQCTSTNSSYPFMCNEFLTDDNMQPQSCKNVYNAQYCIKHVGRFEALTLDCYQCTSADEWKCENSELATAYLQPRNCNHVYDARYCVKSIGRYGDGVGTKRFCSSVHLGNYCSYVRQPGDQLSYRTCVYTCTSDGCNSAPTTSPSGLIYVILSGVFIGYFGFFCFR